MQMYVPRTYVIEQSEAQDGGTLYAAFWPDHQGFASFMQRLILTDSTASGIKEKMARHYPGSECAYEPPEGRAAVAAAMQAMKGGE